VPGATPEEAAHFRELALKNIRYVLDMTDANFMTPHYSRGRDWGKTICEWQYNFLFRSAKIIHERSLGTPAFRAELDRVILGGTEKLRGRAQNATASEFPGNHFTWTALLLYEVGRHYGRDGLTAAGARAFSQSILPFQKEHGGFPEGGGIVVTYALVTTHAVSDYAELSGDSSARTAVERAFPFFTSFTFPDGTHATVADCRTRYQPVPVMFLPHGFLRLAGGPQFCLDRVRRMRRRLARHPLSDNGAQALAFYADFVERLFRSSSSEAWEACAVPQVRSPVVARLDSADWSAFLSCQRNAESPDRFHLDSQNFVEAWHRKAGSVLGGGNSKFAPHFSTFRKRTGSRGYIPTGARFTRHGPDRAVGEYLFDGDRLQAGVAVRGEELILSFRVLHQHNANDIYEAAVSLLVRPGEKIRFSGMDHAVRVAPNACIERGFAVGERAFTWRTLTVIVPQGTTFRYPVIPYNPYRQDTLAGPDEYVARLCVTLSAQESRIVIRPSKEAANAPG
jgi:hypothetical protein